MEEPYRVHLPTNKEIKKCFPVNYLGIKVRLREARNRFIFNGNSIFSVTLIPVLTMQQNTVSQETGENVAENETGKVSTSLSLSFTLSHRLKGKNNDTDKQSSDYFLGGCIKVSQSRVCAFLCAYESKNLSLLPISRA